MEKKSIEYVLPEEIEKRSFEIIAAELAERGITLPAEQDPVTRRVIHTSADFDYAETMTYSENAVEIAKNLIKNGADIVTEDHPGGYQHGVGFEAGKTSDLRCWKCAYSVDTDL